ncbi:hypothetical protein GHA87_15380, partial [Enterococcus faecium]|nr:hypothetical protein [Enterococcus faecium]
LRSSLNVDAKQFTMSITFSNVVEQHFGFESIPRTRFVRIFSRFQRVSISSFRPAVKPKPFDR